MFDLRPRRILRRSLSQLGIEVRRTGARTPARPAPARGGLPGLGRHVVQLLRARHAELVLDVGANVGAYGLLLRRAGYTGRIVSFEPVRAAFDELAAAAAADPDWDVRNVALGRETGTRTITVMDKTTQSSFLPPSALGRDLISTLRPAYEETVTVRRLDELFDEIRGGLERPATYLKMDTQGYDLEVLAGAEGILDHVVALQSEVSILPLYDGAPPWLDAIASYEKLGFEPTGFYPVGRDRGLRLTECDCVMARPVD